MKINSIIDLQSNKQKETVSVSSISGLTPVTENTPSSSIMQCSESWKYMQQSIQMEDKQNKKEF